MASKQRRRKSTLSAPRTMLRDATSRFLFGYAFGFALGAVLVAVLGMVAHAEYFSFYMLMGLSIARLLGGFVVGLVVGAVPSWIFYFIARDAWSGAETIPKIGPIPGIGAFLAGLLVICISSFSDDSFAVELIIACVLSFGFAFGSASLWAQKERIRRSR